jgi:hypothetical protein
MPRTANPVALAPAGLLLLVQRRGRRPSLPPAPGARQGRRCEAREGPGQASRRLSALRPLTGSDPDVASLAKSETPLLAAAGAGSTSTRPTLRRCAPATATRRRRAQRGVERDANHISSSGERRPWTSRIVPLNSRARTIDRFASTGIRGRPAWWGSAWGSDRNAKPGPPRSDQVDPKRRPSCAAASP